MQIPILQTLTELEAVRLRHPEPFASGSAEETAALARFTDFYARLAADRIEKQLDLTYAPEVYFNDTLKEVHGSIALADYLRESASAVEDCVVEYQDISRNAHGEYLVRWKMMIRFRKFVRGQDTWSIGISHLRFAADGRVVYHQDYWNAADGVYQHIPLLGWMIRAIKRRV